MTDTKGRTLIARLHKLFPAGTAPTPSLTPVTFAAEARPAGVGTSWVIDFGTSATVMAQILSLPGARLQLDFFIGETERSSDMFVSDDYNDVRAVGLDQMGSLMAQEKVRHIPSFKRLIDLQS
jgi:hypothetical protein